MKLFGLEITRPRVESKASIDDVLRSLIAARDGTIAAVTPETCMRSPTVHAIVTAISRRIAVSAIHVYEKATVNGLDAKKPLPNHPVAKLLSRPNDWQTRINYWQDATSALVRYGNFFAYKSRGSTGPIRALEPIENQSVLVKRASDLSIEYEVNELGGRRIIPPAKMHHVRSNARNFYLGDSPIEDVKIAIALEIAAEEFGATFFANGAMPLMVFKYAQGAAGFKKQEDETQFIQDFQNALGGGKRHKALLLPKGIETGESPNVENDKSQFLESRKYQRTVIAGAFGVPPHLVGDLERATFNNVEQQDSDFTLNVVMPYAQIFEAAMERDLLTDADRAAGIVIRFNLDSILRADFKSRQEGLRIQRDSGVLSPNEWREIEAMNPISEEDGGNDYVRPANFVVAGKEPPPKPPDTAKPLNDALAKLRQAAESL